MFLVLPSGSPPCGLPEVQIHEVHGEVGDNGPKRCSSVHLFLTLTSLSSCFWIKHPLGDSWSILQPFLPSSSWSTPSPGRERWREKEDEGEKESGLSGRMCLLPFIIMHFLFGNVKDYVYCVINSVSMFFSCACGLVQPLPYLHRTGKPPCIRGLWGRGDTRSHIYLNLFIIFIDRNLDWEIWEACLTPILTLTVFWKKL